MTQAWNEFESEEEIVEKTKGLRQGNARLGIIVGLLVVSMMCASGIFYLWNGRSETEMGREEVVSAPAPETTEVQEVRIVEPERTPEVAQENVVPLSVAENSSENLPEISVNENRSEEPEQTGCEIDFSH